MRISCDDAAASDVRIAELCDKYHIELIFYWPAKWKEYAREKGFKPLLVKDAQELAWKHEIGSHTITHPILTKIPLNQATYEIHMSKILLQSRFGKHIEKFAPPRGYLNPELTAVVNSHYREIRLTKGEHLVHIHPNSGANGNRGWRESITDKTTELWCHSWELDRFYLWEELEEFMKARNA